MSEDTTTTKTAVEELAELEAQEAAEAAAERKGKAEADARVELANRKVIRELKAKNPGVELRRVDTIAGMAIIRAPEQERFDRFNRAALDENQKATANKMLAFMGTIYPDPDTLEDWGKDRPAIFNSLAARIIELAGSDTTVKKV